MPSFLDHQGVIAGSRVRVQMTTQAVSGMS